MKIVCEFENLAEVEDFLCGVLIAPNLVKAAREEAPAPKAAEPKKAETPKPRKAEEPKTEAPKPERQEAQPIAEKAPSVTQTEESTEPAPEKAPVAIGHTESDLKLLLSDKLKHGKRAAIKELFDKHEVVRLTDLIKKEKDNIDAVYAEAEVL